MPCMHEVFQHSLCLLEQETQTNPLWAPQQGLVFVMSNDVIYGGLSFDIIYVHTWPLGISSVSDRQNTVDHCLRLKRRTLMIALVSLLAAFVEVWPIFILLCSGGLAYIWQWRIGYKPQSTIFRNFFCQSCKRYFSRSCLMLHYQWWTGIYCINSLAICKGSTPSSLVLILFLSVYRQSFICITFLLKNYLDFRHVVHY
jgi:hypothetical protein